MSNKINRAALVNVLNKIKPALSTQDFLPVLSCFCFDEENVYAYNDVMAIVLPNAGFPIEGAIPGDRLLKVLNSFSSKEISCTVKNNDIKISSGKSNIKLPFLKDDDFVWDGMQKKVIEMNIDKDFINGLKLCLISIGQDVMHPEHAGVQLSCEDGSHCMYSTDNLSLSRYVLKSKVKDFDSIILPEAFCQQLIALFPEMEEPVLRISKGSICVYDDENITIFSKFLYQGEGSDFSSIIFKYKKYLKNDFYSIADTGLVEALERALIVNGDAFDKKTDAVMDKGILELETQTEKGRVEDLIKMSKSGKGKTKVEVSFATDIILRASKLLEKVSFNKDIIFFKDKKSFVHLIAPKVTD